MCGSIPLLPQDAYMAWCSVKAQGQLYLTFSHHIERRSEVADVNGICSFVMYQFPVKVKVKR